MELGGVLRARRAPATGGKEAAQGATRCDRHSPLATGRGGDSPSSATAAKALLGRAAGGRQHATGREARDEVSSVRNLRSPWPLTLPLPLHDCGAAADLPGGRPRKSVHVSSAAPTSPTPRPRGTEPCGRDVRASYVGAWGAGAESGRGLGLKRRGAGGAGLPTVYRWFVPAGDHPQGLHS